MQRSTSPTQMSPDSSVHYTRTGRISKAKKGLKVHHCDCGRVSDVQPFLLPRLFYAICRYVVFPRSPIVYNASSALAQPAQILSITFLFHLA